MARKLLMLLVLAAMAAEAAPVSRRVALNNTLQLPQIARAVKPGGRLRLEGIDVGGRLGIVALELLRFEVFSPTARVVVWDGVTRQRLRPPSNVYYRGSIDGEPQSLALLTFRQGGGVRGIVAEGGRVWVLGGGARAGGPAVGIAARQIDLEGELGGLSRAWSCGADDLQAPPEPLHSRLEPEPAPLPQSPESSGLVSNSARIAIETDHEFFDLFGNATDAIDYIGDLIAYGSTVYSAEVDTSWVIEIINLFAGGSDPWQETNPTCGLFEFGRYWNDNHGGIDRTLTHFLSGKNSGGGVAWVGVLCRGAFNYNHGGSCPGLTPQVDNYGGGYGYSGGLRGNFDIQNPAVVWDMVVVSHEIGHNFDSPHTHCYGGIGGNPDPVDECYAGQCSDGCYCGPQSLPQPQNGSCGSGEGCGTIMSYCHLLGGGVSNISLTLGLGHPYGTEPQRVAQEMQQHVASTAAGNPSCLAPVLLNMIFEDEFESGDTSRWDGTSPPSP